VQGLAFDERMARGVEAIYRTPDVAAQRSLTLAALALLLQHQPLLFGAAKR